MSSAVGLDRGARHSARAFAAYGRPRKAQFSRLNTRLSGNFNKLDEEPRGVRKQLLINSDRLGSILAEGCHWVQDVATQTVKFKGEF